VPSGFQMPRELKLPDRLRRGLLLDGQRGRRVLGVRAWIRVRGGRGLPVALRCRLLHERRVPVRVRRVRDGRVLERDGQLCEHGQPLHGGFLRPVADGR